jgi:hypothetical protein
VHSIQAQPADRRSAPAEFNWAASAFRRLRTILAPILGQRPETNHAAAPGYEGYGWCDSSEAQINLDIASCRRTWLR